MGLAVAALQFARPTFGILDDLAIVGDYVVAGRDVYRLSPAGKAQHVLLPEPNLPRGVLVDLDSGGLHVGLRRRDLHLVGADLHLVPQTVQQHRLPAEDLPHRLGILERAIAGVDQQRIAPVDAMQPAPGPQRLGQVAESEVAVAVDDPDGADLLAEVAAALLAPAQLQLHGAVAVAPDILSLDSDRDGLVAALDLNRSRAERAVEVALRLHGARRLQGNDGVGAELPLAGEVEPDHVRCLLVGLARVDRRLDRQRPRPKGGHRRVGVDSAGIGGRLAEAPLAIGGQRLRRYRLARLADNVRQVSDACLRRRGHQQHQRC